jgi:hypothetical protein
LELLSVRHACEAWERRNQVGIAATAVALLYEDHDPATGAVVRVAGKVLPESDQTADAQRVVYDLARVAGDVAHQGGDPRTMCENPEPMTWQARLVGVAVSLLDTPQGTWAQLRASMTMSVGGFDIPGRVLALLGDDTMLLLDRLSRTRVEYLTVASNAIVDDFSHRLGRRWRFVPQLAQLDDPMTRGVWLRLAQLRHVLAGGDL